MSRKPAKALPAPKVAMTMRRALTDPALLGKVLAGDSWRAWRVLLIALMGEALTNDERVIFKGLTGREREPLERVEEFLGIAGRRSGKSRAMAALIVFLACFVDYRHVLAIGERPLVLCLGQNSKQAAVVFGYVAGIIEATPLLAQLVKTKLAETLALTNGVDIEIRAASFRGLRGVTAVAVVADEICFWYSEESGSANPDSAILDAVRPSLATTGGPLICISSPYAKRGELWNAFKRDYGPDGDPRILVAKASSRELNPTLSENVVARAFERDPQAASAEYGGEFRNDVAGFLDFTIVEAAVDNGVTVRPPIAGVRYRSSCDPSGGARDSFTLAICHDECDAAVLDCLVEIRPPFNPTSATAQMAAVLKSYRLSQTIGDRYGAEWVVDAFAKEGIKYAHADRDRSAIYLDVLPMFTSGRVRLLDNSRLVSQFASLERRTSPGGRDRVDHGPGGYDDSCNAVSLALVSKQSAPMRINPEAIRRLSQPLGGRPPSLQQNMTWRS